MPHPPAWALATLGHSCPTYLDALVSVAQPQLATFTPQQLSSTAWALATLDQRCPAFMAALLAACLPHLSAFKPADLADIAWAAAVFGAQAAPDTLLAVLDAAGTHLSLGDLDAGAMVKLHSLVMTMTDAGVRMGLPGPVRQRLLQECAAAWANVQADGVSGPGPACGAGSGAGQLAGPAAAKATLLRACSSLISDHVDDGAQVVTPNGEDSLFGIDLALQLPLGLFGPASEPAPLPLDESGSAAAGVVRVALVVDGPSLYTRSKPPRPLGAVALRNRFLATRGWRVLELPLHELVRAGCDEEEKALAYLTDRLRALLIWCRRATVKVEAGKEAGGG